MRRAERDSASKSTLALVGMRGAGKSTVGRLLAERLEGTFVDTDELIALHTGKTIAQIFADDGEAQFRAWETDSLRLALDANPTVLSVGGGALNSGENRDLIRCRCFVIWLKATLDTLWHRIAADKGTEASRPALTAGPPRQELDRILTEREPLFRESADLAIDTSALAPNQVVDRILRELAAWHI